MPRVSVIIPTYDRRELLEDTVKSVLSQSYDNLECIVVDGGSTDGTRAFLQGVDDERLQTVFRPEPRGLSNARNKGVEEAEGEYIVFVDDDDRLYPGAIAKLVETIRNQPQDVAGVYTGYVRRYRSDKTQEMNVVPGRVETRGNASIRGPSCTLLRTSVFDDVGGFDESLSALEDDDLWIRVLSRYDMVALDQVLYERRMHDGQMSKDHEQMLKAGRAIIEKHGSRLSSRQLASRYQNIGKRHAEVGDIRRARSSFRDAITFDRWSKRAYYYYLWLQFGSAGYNLGKKIHHEVYRPVRAYMREARG